MSEFRRAMPVLPAADVSAAAAWWRDSLGFEVQGLWLEDDRRIGFAILRRGTITVGFANEGKPEAPRRGWAAYFYVADVDAYHAELVARGVDVSAAPADKCYGCRDFDLSDRDGNCVAFGQDLNPPAVGPGL